MAKPFQNQGWPYFRKMEELMLTTVTGVNVYHAASAPPSSSQPPPLSSINSDNDSDSLYAEERPNEPSDIEEVCH